MILAIAGAIFWAAAIPIKKGLIIIGAAIASLILVAGLVLLLEKHHLLPSFLNTLMTESQWFIILFR